MFKHIYTDHFEFQESDKRIAPTCGNILFEADKMDLLTNLRFDDVDNTMIEKVKRLTE